MGRRASKAKAEPTAFRFKDGRTGALGRLGVSENGVYEITDTTRGQVEELHASGLIDYIDAPVGVEPVSPAADEPIDSAEPGEPAGGE